jgi:hypothetical protein
MAWKVSTDKNEAKFSSYLPLAILLLFSPSRWKVLWIILSTVENAIFACF